MSAPARQPPVCVLHLPTRPVPGAPSGQASSFSQLLSRSRRHLPFTYCSDQLGGRQRTHLEGREADDVAATIVAVGCRESAVARGTSERTVAWTRQFSRSARCRRTEAEVRVAVAVDAAALVLAGGGAGRAREALAVEGARVRGCSCQRPSERCHARQAAWPCRRLRASWHWPEDAT